MFGVKVQKIDFSINGNQGSFLQTPFWGLFKSRHGWSLIRARAELFSKTFDFTVLVRSFAKGLFSLAYVPLFPNDEFFKAAGLSVDPEKFSLLLKELSGALKALELPVAHPAARRVERRHAVPLR